MKIMTVGNRDGEAAVNWNGVGLATLILSIAASLGAAAFFFAFS